MELALEFTFEAMLGEPLVPGAGPYGTRMIVPLAGGTSAERINGTLAGPARTGRSSADGWARWTCGARSSPTTARSSS